MISDSRSYGLDMTYPNLTFPTEWLINGIVYLTGLRPIIVSANTTNTFKARLDKFWHSQYIVYDFRAQLQGTGSRSEVLCEKF